MTNTDAPSRAPEPEVLESAAIDWEHIRRTGINPLPVRFLQVETSSECNFRCASCALSLVDYDRPARHMTADEFRRVLEAFPDVERVELQGVGEVFLNREIFEIVRAATERGIRVHTFSNASRIDPATARGIVASGLELINLSMDGADEPTFRQLRKGGTLARFRSGVGNLVRARAAAGAEQPKVGIMTVLSKANLPQVPRMLSIAEALGVDHIVFTKLNEGPKPDQRPLLLDEEDRARIAALPARDGGLAVHWAYTPWTRAERMDCYWPKSMAYVTVEGDVTPCCNYFDSREIRLGNVFEQSGAEIWNGEAYRAFRKQLLAGNLPSKCRVC